MQINDPQDALAQFQSADPQVRLAARKSAGSLNVTAITGLLNIAASADRGAAKAARGGLEVLVHAAAAPGQRNRARDAADMLVSAAGDTSRPSDVRQYALYLAGFVANTTTVPALSRLLADREVRDAARMALERTPGKPAERALAGARGAADAEFQSAVDQSLRARTLTRRSVGTEPRPM